MFNCKIKIKNFKYDQLTNKFITKNEHKKKKKKKDNPSIFVLSEPLDQKLIKINK